MVCRPLHRVFHRWSSEEVTVEGLKACSAQHAYQCRGCVPPPSPEGVEVLVGGWREKAWRLLDVGSCYNPFSQWPLFEVTAVDIAPAVEVGTPAYVDHSRWFSIYHIALSVTIKTRKFV